MSPTRIAVLDTNIVLDLFLFQDPKTTSLRQQIHSGQLQWHATAHMRNELQRVLTYPHIVSKLAFYEKSAADLLAAFDQQARLTETPIEKAPYACKDTDDQPFIDLACHLAKAASAQTPAPKIILISKDKAVTALRKRLERLSILVTTTVLA